MVRRVRLAPKLNRVTIRGWGILPGSLSSKEIHSARWAFSMPYLFAADEMGNSI